MKTDEQDQTAINRWRLVLGRFSRSELDFSSPDSNAQNKLQSMEELLDFLYDHGNDADIRTEERSGALGSSQLNACEWITKVRTLFPAKTAEVLEKQALEEFNITELLTDKKVLEQMNPDMNLLKSILQLKHLMSGDVLASARAIAGKIADEIRKKLETDVKRSLTGKLDRNSSSPVKIARNMDIRKTVRKNLKNYDPQSERLVLQDIYFSNRIKKYNQKHIIIAVDESGSMLGSVIHSAVMAQIFASLPFAKVSLVIFDTSVVDLTGYVDDPVQILMSVQLGGGTDIGKAVAYCEQLTENPFETCVLVVTDLYEGADRNRLYNVSNNIITSGAKLSFLTALDENANPVYDRNIGQELANMGAFVGALTPDELGEYIGRMFQ